LNKQYNRQKLIWWHEKVFSITQVGVRRSIDTEKTLEELADQYKIDEV